MWFAGPGVKNDIISGIIYHSLIGVETTHYQIVEVLSAI
jgi:hypothetical protein